MPKQSPTPGSDGQQDIPLDQQNIPQELPEDARERLAEERGGAGKRALFTSDLSVNELALIHDAGFEPVGMVVGSSVYHVGWQPTYAGFGGLGALGMGYTLQDQELDTLTTAKYQARELAMSRMEAEADALGADGVVGVRLTVGQFDWGADLSEFMAVGTAVRKRGSDGTTYRTKFGKPFTSDLSGQEFATLLKSGYRPLGLVMGVSVYAAYQNGYEFQMISGWSFGWTGMSGGMGSYNQEVQHFTDAMYATRNLAMGRMQKEAQELGAEGIVGMRVEVAPSLSKGDPEFWEELNDRDAGMPANHWRTFLVDMFAVGTAVAPLGAEQPSAKPAMMVFLDK
ncbi:MAG: heavy metal-binding domain-containing protein [Chloroflexota bacterium]|nr:heavy metal-binding domain-containing protein [Chloroflexota bacterium]